MADRLEGRKVAFLLTDRVEQVELTEPWKTVESEGGTPELVVPLDSAGGELGLAWPDALPNGKGLLLRSRRSLAPAEFDLIAYEFATRTRHVLTKGLVARYVEPGYLVFVRADGAVMLGEKVGSIHTVMIDKCPSSE